MSFDVVMDEMSWLLHRSQEAARKLEALPDWKRASLRSQAVELGNPHQSFDVVIIPEFLDSESCSVLVNELLGRRGAMGQRVANRVEIPSNLVGDSARGILYTARDFILRVIDERFCPDEEVYPEFVMLQSNYPGDRHRVHADNARLIGAHWGPNHTPQRAFSAGLYLNDCGKDYTGGQLVFPDRKLEIAPKCGMLVAFPSDENFVHEVLPVRTGVRHSILSWFTKDKAHARYV